MTNALKAGLLSALVFPGLGQMVLKRYRRGLVLMLTVLAGLAAIVIHAVRRALAILETIELEGGAVDQRAIADAAAQTADPSGSLTVNVLFVAMTILWIYGAVDAYRIGRQRDLELSRGSGRG
jgi:hypothetical protein